jgi:AraC-like DNA-binding protein
VYKNVVDSAPENRPFLHRIANLDQLVALLSVLPDVSFFIKDAKGRFQALNRRGCDYCGVASEREALGKTDFDFFPKRRAQEYVDDDRTVLNSGVAIMNRVEPAPESEGSPHLVVTNKIPLCDATGTVIGIAGLSRRVEQVRGEAGALRRVAAAVNHLHRHSDQPLHSEDLARQSGLSLRQLERTFRKLLGTTPHQYLLQIRIERACRLLAESDATVAAIAQECGFYDHAHFIKTFQTAMGVTPSVFRTGRRSQPKAGAPKPRQLRPRRTS